MKPGDHIAKLPEGFRVVYSPKTYEERQEVLRRMTEVKSRPFVHIPGNPPQHKVLMRVWGFKLRVKDVEMVYNDMLLINYCYGDGKYEESCTPYNFQALAVARTLYPRKEETV